MREQSGPRVEADVWFIPDIQTGYPTSRACWIVCNRGERAATEVSFKVTAERDLVTKEGRVVKLSDSELFERTIAFVSPQQRLLFWGPEVGIPWGKQNNAWEFS